MAQTIRLNRHTAPAFLAKLDSFAFALDRQTDAPSSVLREEVEPALRRIFDRANVDMRARLASTAQNPAVARFFQRARETAKPDVITYARGGLYNALRFEPAVRRTANRIQAYIRVYYVDPVFDIADNPELRNQLSLARVQYWLQEKFGISTSTDPRTKLQFNPRGGGVGRGLIRYDQLVYLVYASIIKAQDRNRYRSQRLKETVTKAIASSRGNADVSLIKDRIAKKLAPFDKLA